jgi:hypothetical protein
MLMPIMTTKLLPLFLVFFVLVLPFTYPLCHLKNDTRLNQTKEQTKMKIRANRRIGDLDSIYLKINIVTRWGYFLFQNITHHITKTIVLDPDGSWPDPDPLLYVRIRILPSALEGCTKYSL